MNPEDSIPSKDDSKDITHLATQFSTPLTEGPGTIIGPYKLLAKLGEGGFGVVWAAEQREPVKQRVALKIIKVGMDTKQVIARFEAERQALAMMNHPNIAKILGAGSTDSGRPYFCLELIRGIPITQYCDENKLSTKERLALFIKVCHAIQHAHQKGIIHRDIKPSNILVSIHDGEPVPKVIDFGIAKATQQELTEKTIYTQLQQFIGTPAYMSPEQAVMSGLDIDTRSDIYSLGVLMYELLTGRTPFDAKELMESGLDGMRQIIREQEPQRPSTKLSALQNEERTTTAQRRSSEMPSLISVLRGDLDWIVMKALEKDRTRRYDTANGFAMDIRRHLENEPVVARPPSTVYRFEKAWRRNKLAYSAAAAVAASLILGLGLSIFSLTREQEARGEAVAAQQESDQRREEAVEARNAEAEQRRLAQENELRARQLQYAAQVNLAHLAWNDGDLARALELLALQRPGPNQTDLRGFEWRYLWGLCQDESQATLEPFTEEGGVGWHESGLISFSADGSKLAIAKGKNVRVLDFSSRRELNTFTLSGNRITALAFSPTDPGLLAVGDTHRVVLWEGTSAPPAATLATNNLAQALAFSPSGEKLAVGWGGAKETDGRLELWDIETRTRDWSGAEPAHFDEEKVEPTLCLAFSPDGTQLASGGGDTKIKLWEATTGEQLGQPLVGHTAYVLSLDFSPDGQLLASTGIDARILVWDMTTRQAGPEFLGHKGRVRAVAFSPDGKTLVSSGNDSTIRCWDVATSRQTSILRGHTAIIHSLSYTPDGQSLVSVSDKTVKFWDAPPHDEKNKLDNHEGWLDGVVLSPDGGTAAVTDYHAHAVKLWDVRSRSLFGSLPNPGGGHRTLAISPNGKLLAIGGQYGTVRLWDWGRQKEIAVHKFDSEVWQISFSFDSRLLSTISNNRLKIWSTASGQEAELISGNTVSINNAAFSPQGELLATSRYEENKVRLWDINDGNEVTSIPADAPGNMSFSPDGRLLAVSTRNSSISLIDIHQRKVTQRLDSQGGRPMVFSPDSKTLATAGDDGIVRLWNIATGQTALTLQHIGSVTGVSFSNDGTMMATSGADATVRLWPAPSLRDTDER